MAKIVMYATEVCPYCVRAEQLLRRKGVTAIEKIRVDLEPERREEMLAKSNGKRTVPQIFIDDFHVGGCDDLHDLDRQGKLEKKSLRIRSSSNAGLCPPRLLKVSPTQSNTSRCVRRLIFGAVYARESACSWPSASP